MDSLACRKKSSGLFLKKEVPTKLLNVKLKDVTLTLLRQIMKFSVLLPTRNRLDLLRYAITSVVEQDYQDWEIIVSDNFSEEDVKSYIQSLDDPRIKYYRTSSFVSVTDNWNNALEKSSGDYVIMLGDDDCLLKGYFKTCLALLEEYHFPEMIYCSAYTYVYPKVFQPEGFLVTWENASFLSGIKSPYLVDRQKRVELVRKTLCFTVMFNFNMQFSLVSRVLIKRLQNYGPFYQSPYPDYYATTALMLKANSILATPARLVTIGISSKSFGYYYFNNKEKLGVEMLKNIPRDDVFLKLEKYLVPGTNMNSSWLFAMETIKMNFGNELKLKINYKKYRFLQVLHICKRFACKEGMELQDVLLMAKKLRWWEITIYLIPMLSVATWIRVSPNNASKRQWVQKMLYVFSHPSHGNSERVQMKFENILEVFQKTPL